MRHHRIRFLFLNVGHFLDHLFVLIFATAALQLISEWELSYAELIPYATPGFIAFGIGAIPAGWLADRWSREGMLAVFFVGIGCASLLAATADTPLQMAVWLTLIGLFGAIYHPVGLAMVVEHTDRTGMALAVNGMFGNMGVASAALLTGFLIDVSGWRSAFLVPGMASIVIGLVFLWFVRWSGQNTQFHSMVLNKKAAQPQPIAKPVLIRLFGIILFTSALGGFVFQSTTFSLPKVFDERLTEIAASTTSVGWYAFLTFTAASFAQLVVGHLLDRQSLRAVFAAVAGLQALFFLAMTQLDGVLALPVAIAFMLVVFGQIPINDVLIGRITRSEWRSRAFALRSIVSFSVMASALPVVAWIQGGWGFNVLFGTLSVTAMLIFLATLRLPHSNQL